MFVDELGSCEKLFPEGQDNVAICYSDVGHRAAYCVLAVKGVGDLHFGASVDAYQQVARYRYIGGERVDNITDWALNRFHEHYEKGKGRRTRPITKDAIFHYTYAVLHDPLYRVHYAQNLKREFARLPFYPDFWTWADWGEALMKLHVNFEKASKFNLSRTDTPDAKARANGVEPKPILRSAKDNGCVHVDSETILSGVPAQTWSYVLGNRSAIDWVLDQHKEKLPRDPVIRKDFNTYRFADHKEEMIDLLQRVTTVSLETMKIVEEMKALRRLAATS